VRPPEDRPCSDGERELVAGVTAIEALGPRDNAFARLALRTDRAVRPQAAFHVSAGGFLVRENLEQLKSADCGLAHESMILNCPGEVKYIIPNPFMAYAKHAIVDAEKDVAENGNVG